MGRGSTTAIAELLTQQVETKPEQEKPYNVEMDRDVGFTAELEAATNLLLSQLMPTLRDFFIEVADIVLKVPRWQLLLGSMLAKYQDGSLPSPFIDPSWANGVTIVLNKVQCEECGGVFEPTKLGQRFCSNACGVVNNKKLRGLVA